MSTHVLIVVHGLPPASAGGTETYTLDLARALARRSDVRVSILAREGDPLRAELAIRRERRGDLDVFLVNNTFQACESFEATYRNPALRRAVAYLLDEIRPDVAHVQHLTGLSTEILEELANRRVPVVVTLNDYWLMCHRGQLLDTAGRRCDGPGTDGCDSCIPAGAILPPQTWRAGRRLRDLPLVGTAASLVGRAAEAAPASARRRAASLARADHVREMCGYVELFLAPSRTLFDRYLAFGIPAHRLEWIDQGIDAGLCARPRLARPAGAPLRIAFAGSLIASKAPDVLLRAIALLRPGSAALHLLALPAAAQAVDAYASTLEPQLAGAPLATAGPVPHERIGERLASVDVLVVPSIWIENAPFVIREAFAAGVPVVASNLGGMAEMVRDGVDGLLFAPGDAAALAAQLRRLVDDPAMLDRLRSNIRSVMSIDDDAAQLVDRYRRILARRRSDALVAGVTGHRKPVGPRRRLAAVILNYRTPEETSMAVRSVATGWRGVDDLIVVDNGSGDGSGAFLRARCPSATVIESDRNLGFSGGCNLGIRMALERGAAAVLLVNSDAAVAPDMLQALDEALFQQDGVGIVGPVILSRAEPDMVASAGMSFHAVSGRMRHRASGRRLSTLQPGVMRVDAVSGCVMLIRREVFERAGAFDEDYFFSYEDLDFCLRARGAGLDTLCVPAALAYHAGGASIGLRSGVRVYYGVRNHLRAAERLFPLPAAATLARRAAILAFSGGYVALSPDVPILSGMLAVGRGALDHLRGRYGPARA